MKKENAGTLLIQLGNAVTWLRNQKMQSIDLTSSQSGIIQYILRHPHEKVTAGNLIERLRLSKPTISKIIKLLERKGLVERSTDNKDLRKRIIVLTKKGQSLEEELQRIDQQAEEILLYGMTAEETAQFLGLLQKALENLHKRKGMP
ncbi:MarR family transcriptional regulator [Anaerotignum lactatifermentans]|uniref:MarR family transcriptional regulator n=1 Tax=Anaerotignum lactatifermentans TaxID=160404 RepID=A0ABS2GBY0_9FIRM|nr:MarR family transcriptional regulator [Anaerotignum lactatifermentans]MBM6830108.1 MarR family transcriptional regulator [Anaerotignum lactatifermentans]MBM6878660.1 MarR family transcriptional regulator [Anaerotignum lactatifermentans]MBM6951725.1 MarR family transcriptional regulator [Anaerotignum lactatifermentans]